MQQYVPLSMGLKYGWPHFKPSCGKIVIRCSGGTGFGNEPAKAADKQQARSSKKLQKRGRRKSSKGKKTMRMPAFTTTAKTNGVQLEQGEQKEQLLMKAAAIEKTGVDSDVEFNKRLMLLKQQGRDIAAQKGLGTTPGDLYEITNEKVKPKIIDKGENANTGPGQGFLIGLSVVMVIVFIVTSAPVGIGRRSSFGSHTKTSQSPELGPQERKPSMEPNLIPTKTSVEKS